MAPSQPGWLSERPVQLRGSRIARAVLRLAGWQLDFDGLPALQGVLVIYPHTSNWDFIVGILAKWGMGMPVTFWGKDSLFRVPLLGRWLRWLGGVPVDRSASRGMVGQMVEHMGVARERGRIAWLALTPEGTRGRTAGWRSGFYRVAVQAGVPVALAHLDFGRKRVGIGACLQLSGDEAVDMMAIATGYAGVRGKRPQSASPIELV